MSTMLSKRILSAMLSVAMVMPSSFGAVPSVYATEFEDADGLVLVQDELLDEGRIENSQQEDSLVLDESPNIVVQNSGSGLTDFTSPNGELIIDKENGTVTVTDNNDNHYAVYDGLEKKANAFVWEADATITNTDGQVNGSAALIFGLSRKNAPGARWSGANFDSTRGGDDVFRVFGPDLETEVMCGNKDGVDFSQPVHLRLEVDKEGNYNYSFGNSGAELRSVTGKFVNWTGGYVGLLTWDSEIMFSNVSFENRTVADPTDTNPLGVDDRYKTNLTDLAYVNGEWEVIDEGLHSNAVDKGDAFLYSSTTTKDFVYSTDVKFLSGGGAASLLFHNNSTTGHANSYAVNLDAGSKTCKFWRWTDGEATQLIDEKTVEATADNTYTLKVLSINNWVSYYVNDTLVASSGDYTLQVDDKGQDTCYTNGYLGLLNWNGDMIFQNTFQTAIAGTFDPTLDDITVSSTTGTVEGKAQFNPEEPIIIQYVKNDASVVDITASAKSDTAAVVIRDADGNEYADGKSIPVVVGKNYIDVVSTVTADDGTTASLTYRVNVHRRQQDAIYYNEPYRDQYHYSVKDGWGNDPNGLVYYKGTYHFFYQFHDSLIWGPMHWAHATSTDLVHWEEQPMALYPDANGAMFSGCIVADETNASGLFSTSEGGLVALITCDGNGQRIKLAYSEDEGSTWTKVSKIAADWTRDPLGSADFRDPKVFRWEGKWFMVVAGGPLRIYSSENLLDWQCESTYANLHTECPDLYPIEASDGTVKWVLSRGGRYYKVGEFTQVDGSWRFVPDAEYANADGVMNFGKDSYAAMTFYVQDFGTAAAPTLPNIIEINWMNTWEDYCNLVANKLGQQFNGTYNLVLKEGLVKSDDTYLLTQTPVEAYDTLRTDPVIDVKDVEVSATNSVLDDFDGECYEIVSTFRPSEGTTKVGFKLRVGEDESTDVVYDVAARRLYIDRSKSGVQISGRFSEVDGQDVALNEDGSVTMHIYVDRASIEVFSQGHTVAGGNQIFPSVGSTGAQVLVEGEPAQADITIYGMGSIWDKSEVQIPLAIQAATSTTGSMYAGEKTKLKVILLPIGVEQDVSWTIDDESVATLEANGGTATLTALKKGNVKVTATSTAAPELSKTFEIAVRENNFQTNMDGFVSVSGDWVVDDITLSNENRSANDFYMAKSAVDMKEYTLSTKVSYNRGLINIFFAAANVNNPFDRQAYAIQLGDSSRVRLFRFGGDTIAEGEMGKTINDNGYHDVVITKKESSVSVAIDGQVCLEKDFDWVEDYYNGTPYVGFGLWDGAVAFQTLYVKALQEDAEVSVPEGKQLTYTGEEQTGVDPADGYILTGTASATDAGDYVATATLNEGYKWSDGTTEDKEISWSIAKAANTLTASVTAKTQTVTYSAKQSRTLAPNVEAKHAAGEVTYENVSTDKTAAKFKLASTGAVAVPKKTAAGTYKVIVVIKAAGDDNYVAGSKSVTFKVKVARASLAKATIAKIANQAYTGKKILPAPKVTSSEGVALKKNTDYKLTYKNNVKAGTATVTVTGMGNYTGSKTAKFKIVAPASTAKAYMQNKKWVSSSKTTAVVGKIGKSNSIQCIKISLSKDFPVTGGISYRSYVQGKGWEKSWSSNGKVSGVAGMSVEAIQMKLTGNMAKKYDVYYRVHTQKYGWMGWAKNGASAGTTGYGYNVDAIQIAYVPKGGKAPAATYKDVVRQTKKAFYAK